MPDKLTVSFIQRNRTKYRTTVILLVSSMIGIGYLTLPSVLRKTGLFLGLLLIIISSFVSLFGSYQISRAFQLYPMDSYPQLMEKVCGKKWRILLTWDLFFYLLFSNTMFIYFSRLKRQPSHRNGTAEVQRQSPV